MTTLNNTPNMTSSPETFELGLVSGAAQNVTSVINSDGGEGQQEGDEGHNSRIRDEHGQHDTGDEVLNNVNLGNELVIEARSTDQGICFFWPRRYTGGPVSPLL